MFPEKQAPLNRIRRPSSSVSAGRTARKQQTSHLSDLNEVCQLLGAAPIDDYAAAASRFEYRKFRIGDHVHRIGQPFRNLYLVAGGFLKTRLVDSSGNEQILSFPMKGDLLGVDGIHAGAFGTESLALTAGTVIVLPFKQLAALGKVHAHIELALYRVMGSQLMREQHLLSMLCSKCADVRVARFLITLAARYAAIGYSDRTFNLRMSRQDIGSYLGMAFETVSRTLGGLQNAGLITVEQRAVTILDPNGLKTLRRIPASIPRSIQKPRKHRSAARSSQYA